MTGWLRRHGESTVQAVPVVLVALFTLGMAWAVEHTTYQVWGGVVVSIGLVAVSVAMIRRVTRNRPDPWLARFLGFALLLKFVGAVVRYYVAFGVYDGVADAGRYSLAGTSLSESWREGVFVSGGAELPGTDFISLLTGGVYTVTWPTLLGGFLVFAWLGFWGLFLFYRAFEMAVPEGLHRRYALLVFLLPSMLFWPSSIGKEAWMTLTLGLVAYGAARLLTARRWGFLTLALGVGGVSLVRPHISVVVMAGVLVGYVFRRTGGGLSMFRPVLKVAGVAILILAAAVVVREVQDYFEAETLDQATIERILEETQEQTGQGGSFFEAQPVQSPLDFPQAAITVMFRPFPWEVDNPQALLASVEGAFLLLAFLVSWRRVLQALRMSIRRAYVAFAVTYTLVFVFAFSNIANFGILTRQRVQLLPFVLVLLALPLPALEARARTERAANADTEVEPAGTLVGAP